MVENLARLFKLEERKKLLSELGYTVEEVDTFEPSQARDGGPSRDVKVWVAHKEPIDWFDLQKEAYFINQNYGLDRVFDKELEVRIKNHIYTLFRI